MSQYRNIFLSLWDILNQLKWIWLNYQTIIQDKFYKNWTIDQRKINKKLKRNQLNCTTLKEIRFQQSKADSNVI